MTLLDRLVSSWILESYMARGSDGTVHEPFGPKPVGLLVYGADGRAAVQAMDPRRPAWASDAPDEQRHAERAAAADGYIAYAGRFEVEDGDEPFVVHHVETSLVPTGWAARSDAPSRSTATGRSSRRRRSTSAVARRCPCSRGASAAPSSSAAAGLRRVVTGHDERGHQRHKSVIE